MDITPLLFKLELAGFVERERLAAELARSLEPSQLDALVPHLKHSHAGVRQGVMTILAEARHRPALEALLQVARERTGDDRVFAIRALARLAQPEDTQLRPLVDAWLKMPDAFVQAQARALAQVLGTSTPHQALPPPAPSAQPASRAVTEQDGSGEKLVAALLEARGDAVRIDLVNTMEQLPPPARVVAAGTALAKGNADVVALVARLLARVASEVPAQARPELCKLMEAARERHKTSALACAAVDEILTQWQASTEFSRMMSRLHEMEVDQVDKVASRLAAMPLQDAFLHAPALLDALRKKEELWSVLAPVLARMAPSLRPAAKAELRTFLASKLSTLPTDGSVTTKVLVALAQLLAQCAEPGESVPARLFTAMERVAEPEGYRALCEVCVRLGTEDAAFRLVELLADPLPEVKEAARSALTRFPSESVRVEGMDSGAPTVVATYRTADGQPLKTEGRRLVLPSNGEEYALDGRGRPVRVKDVEFGACRCCRRSRVLVRGARGALLCPQSGEGHLVDNGKVILEKDHPLGRCKHCESIKPLVREGARVFCPLCRTVQGATPAVPGSPSAPGTDDSAPRKEGGLPQPPSREDLQLIEPTIRQAMAANVFIIAKVEEGQWSGSGLIVARNGQEVAILTNRHVVQSDDARQVPTLSALTLSGELVPVETVWMASAGVDLALVQARLEKPDAVGVMPIGQGACLVGCQLFAVGNPLGLSWSYTSGSLSAFRDYATDEGVSMRVLQTQVPVAPGSSGGGLFHKEGHLVGIIVGGLGKQSMEAHFAISVKTVRETLEREHVTWAGRPLI